MHVLAQTNRASAQAKVATTRTKLNALINSISLELSKEKSIKDKIKEKGYPTATETHLGTKVAEMKTVNESRKHLLADYADPNRLDMKKCEDC